MKYPSYAIIICLFLFSCQDDEDTNNFGLPASLVRFSATEASSVEGSGFQQVRVSLDHPQEGKTLVNFAVEGNFALADAQQSGDVRFITPSPLVIEAGETEAFIEFELLEDLEFEVEPETITFTLNDILEGNARLSTIASERIYRHTIQENEYELSLEWDQSEAASSNVELVVELPNNALLISDSPEGFEKVILNNVDENASYLVTVWYYQGEAPVNYELFYRKAGSKALFLKEGSFQTGEANREFSLTNGDGTRHYKMIRSGTDLLLIER
ncbi:MAG: hypothetical protein RIG62_15975 [Cyclobacteriaceae bacterium]